MPNPHGTPIWYELVSEDADASRAFYDRVIGWTTEGRPDGDMDYRMIATANGDFVGGLAGVGPGTPAVAATPGWRFYIGVDDVDATVTRIVEAGGQVLIPAFDLPGVGRMAFVADPQGVRFFAMRGASDADSTAFNRAGMGKCTWNELSTPDQTAANAFYADVFGWTYPDRMTMPGDLGDYVFVDAAGQRIGATMTRRADGPPPGWYFYFRTPDIAATATKVGDAGGTILFGPAEVPGGDRIIFARDPQGSVFGAVGPGDA